MTNIVLLPQLAPLVANTPSFAICTNADWRDIIQFNYPTTSQKAGQPMPLDGIAFRAMLRSEVGGRILLDMSTSNGLLETDNNLGLFKFAVPIGQAQVAGKDFYTGCLPVTTGQPALLDIIAQGLDADNRDTWTVNLCQQNGPLLVTIGSGITDFNAQIGTQT